LFINPRSGNGKAGRAGLAERARDKGIETVMLARARTWPRWPVKPLQVARTCSGSSSSTHPATARAFRAGHGARRS
jgi:hypothetical protein